MLFECIYIYLHLINICCHFLIIEVLWLVNILCLSYLKYPLISSGNYNCMTLLMNENYPFLLPLSSSQSTGSSNCISTLDITDYILWLPIVYVSQFVIKELDSSILYKREWIKVISWIIRFLAHNSRNSILI